MGAPHILDVARFAIVAAAIIGVVVASRLRGVRPSGLTVSMAFVAGVGCAWIIVDAPVLLKVLLFPVWMLIAITLVNASFAADVRADDQLRQARIEGAVLAGKAPSGPFGVYLRPFAVTDRLAAQPPRPASSVDVETHLDLEPILVEACGDDLPLVALGAPAEMTGGAARLTVAEAEWHGAVDRLTDRAAMLVILPSAHAGTRWELELLRRTGRLGKTVMLMPEGLGEPPLGVMTTWEDRSRLIPGGVWHYDPEAHAMDHAEEWKDAVVAAEACGIQLPHHARAGALFTVEDDNGRVSRIAPLPLSILSRRAWYARAALQYLGCLAGEVHDQGDVLAALEEAAAPDGRTREYVLVIAAHAYITWGKVAPATRALQRALLTVGPSPLFTVDDLTRVDHLLDAGFPDVAATALEVALNLFDSVGADSGRIQATRTRLTAIRGSTDASPGAGTSGASESRPPSGPANRPEEPDRRGQ